VDFKIVWTLRARQDLREIATFIAAESPSAALRLGDQIFTRVKSLEQFPELGRVVPNYFRSTLREIVVKPYRIIYRFRPKEKAVEILRVWHGARGEPEV
jgi:plasmid stabilization system protein ParE